MSARTDPRFDEALSVLLDLSAEDREEYLDREGFEPELRRRLRRALESEQELGSFLDGPAAKVVDTDLPETIDYLTPKAGRAPSRVGSFRIVSLLGAGGMGQVYLAEQEEPVKRRVAIKLIKFGDYSDALRTRFAAEQQAMARLSHPNVAALYEAGTSEDGRAYFAMELVSGQPLTVYCDEQRLDLDSRLRLLIEVCAGVQHAHEKGLIHRDLKPSNILVGEVGDQTVVKVIDFGVAKAIDDPLAEGTLLTGDAVIGTPGYLSPEAIREGSGFALDTRSDVYSLGVILHELVVGVRAFETSNLPLFGVLKKTVDEDPPGPVSHWRSLSQQDKARVAESRSLGISAFEQRLQGDLEHIVLKALDRDRSRRYSSAAELAADLRRLLAFEPIESRESTTIYRLRMFTRRNRSLVVAVALTIASLIGGTVVSLVKAAQARASEQRAIASLSAAEEARREADLARSEAEEVSEFLLGVFEVTDPTLDNGGEVTARELLDQAADRVGSALDSHPTTRARFLSTIGRVYLRLSLWDQAEVAIRSAVELLESGPDVPPLALAEGLGLLAESLGRRPKHHDESMAVYERALTIYEAELGPNHVVVAELLLPMAWRSAQNNENERATEILERIVRIFEASAPEHPSLGQALSGLGDMLRRRGNYDRAEETIKESIRVRRLQFGDHHLTVARSLNQLALLYGTQGRYAEQLEFRRQGFEITRTAIGEPSPEVAIALYQLGASLREVYRLDESIEHIEKSLEMGRATFPENHPHIALTLHLLSMSQFAAGLIDPAFDSIEESLRLWQAEVGLDHSRIAEVLDHRARLLAAADRLDEARSDLERAITLFEKHGAVSRKHVLGCKRDLARVLVRSGELEAAETLLADIIDEERIGDSPEHRKSATWVVSGLLKVERNLLPDAIGDFEVAIEKLTQVVPENHPSVAVILRHLGETHVRSGSVEVGLETLRSAHRNQIEFLPADHPEVRKTLELIGRVESTGAS